MENTEVAQTQQLRVDQLYEFAAHLLVNKNQTSPEVIQALIGQGMDEENASVMVSELENEIKAAKKSKANKDMLYGALWCGGGTIATMADIGFIFWGAIVFGGIQFIRGLMNSM